MSTDLQITQAAEASTARHRDPLQSRVNAAIEALNELHGDALIDPVALSNGSDHGPPR
jgi:hypothetical protein